MGCCHANPPVQQSSKMNVCDVGGWSTWDFLRCTHFLIFTVGFFFFIYIILNSLLWTKVLRSVSYSISSTKDIFFPPATLRIKSTHLDLFCVHIIFCNFSSPLGLWGWWLQSYLGTIKRYKLSCHFCHCCV